MRKIYKLLFASIMVFLVNTIAAQSFNTSIGARFGDDVGISIAQRIGKRSTIQLNHELGLLSASPITTAYFVKHMPLITKRLNFILGGGIYTQFVSSQNDDPSMVRIGPAGTFGLDFTLGRLNMSADWSPTLNIKANSGKRFNTSSGVTLRYVIYPRKSKFKSWRERTWDKIKGIGKRKKK